MKRIRDVLTSILFAPILLLAALCGAIYFMIRFPIWYLNYKKRKKK